MRVAIVTESFLPKVDGIVTTLCKLLDHLALRGHESLIFAPSGGLTHYAQTPIIGFRAYAFPPYPEIKLVPPVVNLTPQLAAFRPHLVHLVNPVLFGLAGLRSARRLGIPIVASYHTDVPGFAKRWGFNIWAAPLRAYLRWLHNKAAINFCPSVTTKQELEAHGFQRVRVWTCGVDTERFHPNRGSHLWRERLSAGHPDAPLLLSVGRVSPEKRLEWLRPVLEALPGARLAIVGDGPTRQKMEQYFAGTPTVFTGYLYGDDLAQAYAAADIFVFPAANETFGMVALEAMASGLPVVAARAGGPLDFIVEGETGLLFDPNDQEALIRTVCQLVNDSEYANDLGVSARKHAETRSWTVILDDLLQDYASLINLPLQKSVA